MVTWQASQASAALCRSASARSVFNMAAHALLPPVLGRPEVFVAGKWVLPASGATLPVINPATEAVVGSIGVATAAEVDAAVTAARAAFPGWVALGATGRGALLRKVAALVRERKPLLAVCETADNGKPLDEAEWDMDDVATCFEYFADLAEKQEASGPQQVEVPDDRFTCALHKRPLGVAALITPFNYPLLMATWKVAPCLAAGCCAVLKPSEQASVTCQMLGDIVADAGIPPGVLSILTGDGPTTGSPLVVHPGIDKVAFTGSLATGIRVMKAAADRVVPVTLELGGKSPLLVFADACASEADIDKAAEWAMFGCMWTNGQICSATSRLLLQRSVADAFLDRLKHHCANVVVGDPLERATRLGPIVSAAQYTKVMAHIQTALAEGATLLTGGARPERCGRGYFVQPTVLTGVTPAMRIFREEVFGPVLAVTLFDTEEEAMALAGDTDFGLGAAVITSDPQRCDRVAQAFHAGIVWQNCSQPCFCHAPWGGFKRSGFGRELGPNGLDGYQGVKQITKYTSADQFCWYPSFKKD